jgi:hypothetical protein
MLAGMVPMQGIDIAKDVPTDDAPVPVRPRRLQEGPRVDAMRAPGGRGAERGEPDPDRGRRRVDGGVVRICSWDRLGRVLRLAEVRDDAFARSWGLGRGDRPVARCVRAVRAAGDGVISGGPVGVALTVGDRTILRSWAWRGQLDGNGAERVVDILTWYA